MIHNRIYEWARTQPAKNAIIYDDAQVDYGSFARAIEAARLFLEKQELTAGRTAMVLVENMVDAWILVIALRTLGLHTLCAPSLAEADNLQIGGVAYVVLTQAESSLQNHKSHALAGKRVIVAPKMLHAGIPSDELPVPRQTNRTFGGHILYTSGTTGIYKKVFLDGVHEEGRSAERARAMAFGRNTVHHGINYGLWTGAGFKQPSAAWHVGGCIVLDSRPDIFGNFFRHGITSAALLPPMVKQLLDLHASSDMTREISRNIQIGLMSGFISLDLAERARRYVSDHFIIRYSATELMSVPLESHFENKDDLHWLSAANGQTVQIVDESGKECPAGQEGELRILTTDIDCSSYIDDEETSARVFRDGFFYPGDLAVRREDGRIRVLGRTADVLNVQGQKMAVAPIEQAIQRHLQAEEVCVFSGLDDSGDEELIIAIQSNTRPTQQQRDAVTRMFPSFERIRFAVLENFPRTETGMRKTRRPVLRMLVSADRIGGIKAPSRPVAREKQAVRVVVYGTFTPNWMTALEPGAPVWKDLPRVREVLMRADRMVVQIPPPSVADMQTVVLPLMETHTLNCPRQFLSLIPERRSIEILGNKGAFSAYAKANGLAHLCPAAYTRVTDLVYPCVLKRLDMNSGHGVAIVQSHEHLRLHLAHETWRGKTLLLQELIPGDTEYVTHCVCRNGRILWHRTFSYEMGPSETIRTPQNTKIVRPAVASMRAVGQIESFLLPLSYTGPCNVDYKLSGAGDIVVFEINPRLGGSLMRPENVEYLREALSCIVDEATEMPA